MKVFWKAAAGLLLSLCLVIGAVGCGEKPAPEDDSSQPAQQQESPQDGAPQDSEPQDNGEIDETQDSSLESGLEDEMPADDGAVLMTPAGEGVVKGIVKEVSGDTLKVQRDDGSILAFSASVTGTAVGDNVVVYFTGEIAGEDTTGATVTGVDVIK